MVLPRSHALRLIASGAARPGALHRAPDGRAFRELLRAGTYRIDHFLDDPHELGEGRADPPAFLPIAAPRERRKRGPRRPAPSYDVLTEAPPGRTPWRRKRSKYSEGETEAERAARAAQGEVGKNVSARRKCPNCGILTNAARHCVGTLTVSMKPAPPPPSPSVLGPDRPYKPPKFRRVCRRCGDLTNDAECCETPTLCR